MHTPNPPQGRFTSHRQSQAWRGQWLLLATGLGLFAGLLPVASAASKSVEEIRALRKEVSKRPRQLVMHADGRPMDPSLDQLEPNAPPLVFPHLPGTAVRALTYSLIHQFNVSRLYRSKVAQEWPAGYVKKLYGEGPDGLQIYTDFCRKHGFEAWFTMRANDTHDYSDDAHGRMRWDSNPFKQNHPELLHGTREKKPPLGRWSAVDYAQAKVRDQIFLMLQEVCQNYDIDGVQLDFIRHLNILKSVAWGSVAPAAEVEMITDLMRRLRQMMDEEGARRGKPILFCVRTPDSVEYAKATGLDVKTWMQEGLIDVWAVGGYFELQDLAASVRVARQHGCQIWATMDSSRTTLKSADATTRENWSRTGVNTIEGYRGRAMTAWRAGVDSIDLFNFFVVPNEPHFGLLNEVHDPKKLAWQDKLYVPDPLGPGRGSGPGRWLKDGERFFKRPLFDPTPLAPQQIKTVHIKVADDVSKAESNGRKAHVSLEVIAPGVAASPQLTVRLNDKLLKPTGAGLSYEIDPSTVKIGDNILTLTPQAGIAEKSVLEDLRLWIRYKAAR